MFRGAPRLLAPALLAACSSAPALPQADGPFAPIRRTVDDPPNTVFPSPEALAQLADGGFPTVDKRMRTTAASFAVPKPIPRSYKPAPPIEDEANRLLTTLHSSEHRPTAAAQCVARSLAAFVLEHRTRPDPGLQAYILAKCRAPWTTMSSGWSLGGHPASAPMDAWHQRVTPRLRKMLKRIDTESGRPLEIALATVRVKDRAISLLAYGRPAATISVAKPAVSGRAHVVRGRLLQPASAMTALINRGSLGVARCSFDPRVALPDFTVSCPFEKRNGETWIELGVLDADGINGTVVARLLTSAGGKASEVYKVPRRPIEAGPVMSAGELGDRIIAAVNALRKRAGLTPLIVDPEQTATARELVPYYFAGQQGTATERHRTVELGLRAGWNVDGVVRYGAFTAASASNAKDPSALLGALMSRPQARRVLMDPKATRAAVGAIWSAEHDFVGVGIATYVTMDDLPLAQLQALAARSLRTARERRGLGDVRAWDIQQTNRERIARAIIANETTGADAREWLASRYGPPSRWNVSGTLVRAHHLEQVPWPESILSAPSPRVDIMAAYRKPAGHPWAQYEIVVLVDLP